VTHVTEDRPPQVGPLPDPGAMSRARRIGLIGGIALFLAVLLLPPPGSLSQEAWTVAAVLALMGSWWLTEAVPIPVTALLPLVLFPLLGISTMQEAATPYANEIIFLFMGSFFLAVGMEKWGVHRRFALAVMTRTGTSPKKLLFGFMAATAFVSMWINNTATAAMMLPIAIALGRMFQPPDGQGRGIGGSYNFGVALMLGIAYASSIGGVATLIGTAPNVLFAAAASELLGIEVGFLEWLTVGIPVAGVLLPLSWLVLTTLYPPEEPTGSASELLAAERAALGAVSRGERYVTVVFVLTVLAWMTRVPKDLGFATLPGITMIFPEVTDGTIAMLAALALFAWPLDRRTGAVALDWEAAARIPWGVLLLFGGGLSLALGMSESGLAAWIGGSVSGLAGAPTIVIVGATVALFVFLTEITSNTAVTAMAMPITAGVAVVLGLPPAALMAATAIACSMAFMMPAGTPPNAIVFGSGYVSIGQMAWAGIWVNLVSIVVVTMAGTYLLPWLFGG
jgi:solute carrier family 13 (sodium-dependent dicarboxylate transporter), member 2/3/5